MGFERRKNVSHDPKPFDGRMMYLQNSVRTHCGFQIYSDVNINGVKSDKKFYVTAISSMCTDQDYWIMNHLIIE